MSLLTDRYFFFFLLRIMNVEHLPPIIHLHLCPLQARMPRVRRVENFLELLQRLASRLDKEEEDYHNLHADPHNVHQIELPPNLLNAHRDAVHVDDYGDVEEEEVETGALGARAVLETFDRIEGLEGCPAPCEEDAEEVDGDDGPVWSCTMGEFRSPSPWYLTMIAIASSLRSLAMSHLGVSGKNMMKTMTIDGRMHCTTVGSRQAHDDSLMWRLVP